MVFSRSANRVAPTLTPERSCFAVFERELDYVVSVLLRFGARRADMDDLIQEVFTILLQSWPALDTTSSLRPWLFGVAFRVVRTHRRRGAREIPAENLETPDLTLSPEGWTQRQESLVLLMAALDRVPAPRRAAIRLHDIEGIDVAQIARQFSITKVAVYARLYKGRKELAAALRALSKDDGWK